MAYISISKVKKLISEIVTNRWSDTKIIDVGNSLLYDIQHKYEKVSYSVTFEIKDEVMNMHFRSTPYEKEEITVDCDCIEAVRFGFLQNTRTGVTGIGLEFEDAEEIIGVVPTICFNYWVFLDVEEDTLKETMKTLLEVIVPSDCIQLIKYLRSTPAYLA